MPGPRSGCSCGAGRRTSPWRWSSTTRACRGRTGRLEILFCALDDFGVGRLLQAVPGILLALGIGLPRHARRLLLFGDRLFGGRRGGGLLLLSPGRNDER